MNLCLVKYGEIGLSETFIRAQAQRLPADVTVVEGVTPAQIAPDLFARAQPNGSLSRRFNRLLEVVTRQKGKPLHTQAYVHVLRKAKVAAVLAQYGPTGVRVLDACLEAGVPLVVHFHGYDITRKDILEKYDEAYKRMFESAAGIIAVSTIMREQLIARGAAPEKVYYSPCGVDCEVFEPVTPSEAPPTFVTVGRFVEKKAPHLAILAFAEVLKQHPEARLRMIGDGDLLGVCRDLVSGLKLEHAVTFLGAQPHDVVRKEMAGARAFVQHSVQAASGDCEGTPVAVLEAGASGLPVVATRHAGIADVVLHGETGFLVEERDVEGMAAHMATLVGQPALADEMGRAGHARVKTHFSMERNVERLWGAIQESVARKRAMD